MWTALYRIARMLVLAGLVSQSLWSAGQPSGKFYLHFSGDGQYVEIPSSPAVSFGPAGLTVSAWLRPETLEFKTTEGSGYVYWMGKGERGQHEWALRMYSFTNRE